MSGKYFTLGTLAFAMCASFVIAMCITFVELSQWRICRWVVARPGQLFTLALASVLLGATALLMPSVSASTWGPVEIGATYIFLIWPLLLLAAGILWLRRTWMVRPRGTVGGLATVFVLSAFNGALSSNNLVEILAVSGAFVIWFGATAALPTLVIATIITLRKRMGGQP